MKSKFIAAKIVPTHLLGSPGFKYEVNRKHWIDSWTPIPLDEKIAFIFQVMELEDWLCSNRLSYATKVVYYGYRSFPHTTRISIKEHEGLTPILFRRCR